MKEKIANNKGVTIIIAIVVIALLTIVVAGPTIWAGILAAHGM